MVVNTVNIDLWINGLSSKHVYIQFAVYMHNDLKELLIRSF